MKLSVFLFLLGIISVQANELFSQTSLSMQMKSASVEKVLEEIKQQCDYDFIYDYEYVKELEDVTVDFNKASLDEVLFEVLKNTNLDYRVEDKMIVLYPREVVKPKVKEKTDVSVQQKKKTIKGKVTDDQGTPLPGVSIYVNMTPIGTSTDIDGNYSLEVPHEGVIIVYSFVGMLSQEIIFKGQVVQNITLLPDTEQMGEVTVYATGLTNISKERATGAFVQLKAEQLEQRPVANIIQKLEGTVAGLNSTNGELSIRGRGTFETNSSPLIVVDGFPLTNDESTVNPEDVESVTVLKDAAAASIWGTRASNGVIVITTKRGKAGDKLKVNFSGHLTITEKVDYSDANVISTSDQIDMQLEAIDKGWIDLEQRLGYGNYSFSLLEEAVIYRNGWAPNGNVWTEQQYDSYVKELRGRDLLDQWSDYFLRNEVNQIYNLSLSSSGERNRTYASVNYTDNKSAQVGVDNDQIKLNVQNTYQYNNKLSFDAGVTLSVLNAKNNGHSITKPMGEYGYKLFVDENGNYIKNYDEYSRWVSNEREASDASIMPYYANVLEEQRAMDNSSQQISLRARFALNYEIVKGLKFSSSYQYQHTKYNADDYRTMDRPSQRIKLNEMYVDGEWQIPLGTEYAYNRNSTYSWDFRNTLNFDKDFGKHSLNLFGGMDIRKSYSDKMSDKTYGYNDQTASGVYVDEGTFASGILENWLGERFTDNSFYSREINDVREFSVYANLGYEFDKRYLATGSFRIDQKNLFGSDPAFRYKPLWSAGLGWKISNEDFFDVPWLNRLVIKATYGLGGNASNLYGPFAQARVYNSTQYGLQYMYERAVITVPANEKLKWEETSTLNLSTDFSMFDSRISGSLTYYYKKGTDLLGSSALDPSVGFTSATINYGSIDNRGVELTLNTKLLEKRGLVWRFGGNISYNKNRILDYRVNQTALGMLSSGDRSKGNPFNNVVSVNYAGVDEYGNAMVYITDTEGKKITTKYSNEKFADITTDDLIYHGAKVAPWYGGLNTSITYKGFDLTVNATFKFGHYFKADIGSVGLNTKSRVHSDWANRWVKPGDEKNTRIPKFAYKGLNPYNNELENGSTQTSNDVGMYNESQDVVMKADYLRVRDIILGYNLPKNILNKTFLKSLRITGQVSNPFLWTANKKGYDPETYGREYYSNLKAFTFGLRGEF